MYGGYYWHGCDQVQAGKMEKHVKIATSLLVIWCLQVLPPFYNLKYAPCLFSEDVYMGLRLKLYNLHLTLSKILKTCSVSFVGTQCYGLKRVEVLEDVKHL